MNTPQVQRYMCGNMFIIHFQYKYFEYMYVDTYVYACMCVSVDGWMDVII